MKKTASTLFLMAGTTTLVPLGGKSQSADQVETNDKKPMNIVYIMCDDHAYQTIGAYDRRFVETPHIDWIADNGARFTNSFVANSLSGPSRACMLTGKYSHANGFKDNSDVFDGSQQTFPKLLQQSGYQTAMIGKWHLVSDPTGFDYWDILVGQGNYYNPDFIKKRGENQTGRICYQFDHGSSHSVVG